MADLDAIRDGLAKDRLTAVVPPRPKDVKIVHDLLVEIERLQRGRARLGRGIAECAKEEQRLRDENERMRDAVRDLFRVWCSDEPIWDEHGIDEGFGGMVVHAAMAADVYAAVKRERYARDS